MRVRRLGILLLLLLALVALVAGCGSTKKKAAAKKTGCSKSQLALVKKGRLTVGTDNPAFPPWFGGTPKNPWKVSDPRSGQGLESAVVYAVAKQLGLAKSQVDWTVVPFDQTFKPGPKNFDFAIEQISYTPQRAKAVDFSNSYYDVNQGLVGVKGTPITKVKSIADLKKFKLGVQLGTTAYDYVTKTVKPSQKPSVYSSSTDVNSALKAHQIDGIVVDLPTAFYISGAGQVPNSVVVAQFPTQKTPEHFGMTFAKGDALVSCVNNALSTLQSNGTLKQIQQQWLSQSAGAPVLH